jgi:glutathione synthase/RimK-type ligase-like ATP-grasp enzyme
MLTLPSDDLVEEPYKPPSKNKQPAKALVFNLAVLCHPYTKPAPSTLPSIRHFSRVAVKMGVSVHQIGLSDLDRIHQYDGLWIRHTTSVDNHTFSFACRAGRLGIPVIDDRLSIMSCHNKIPMMTMLNEDGIVTPPTMLLTSENYFCDLQAAGKMELPLVVKVPDGSFGRGMYKVNSLEELSKATADLFRQSPILMVQPFVQSKFDWRIGILDGSPLFACQYHFARGHWQIIKHYPDGKHREGIHYTVPLDEVSSEVLQVAIKATKVLGGTGFYGVDIKDTSRDLMVMEVNDNPNLDHGVEDQVDGDAVWMRLAQWFLDRKK